MLIYTTHQLWIQWNSSVHISTEFSKYNTLSFHVFTNFISSSGNVDHVKHNRYEIFDHTFSEENEINIGVIAPESTVFT